MVKTRRMNKSQNMAIPGARGVRNSLILSRYDFASSPTRVTWTGKQADKTPPERTRLEASQHLPRQHLVPEEIAFNVDAPSEHSLPASQLARRSSRPPLSSCSSWR